MTDNKDQHKQVNSLRQRIESTTKLPAMPDVAQSLLRLNTDPNSNINDLIEIIEIDPSIAAQIMRYYSTGLIPWKNIQCS